MYDTERITNGASRTLQGRMNICMPHNKHIPHADQKGDSMLYTIAAVLVILWLVGLVSSYTIGGFIHILLVIAIVIILLRVISGRKPLG